jgi:diacylglycerol O-acyltransferase-1
VLAAAPAAQVPLLYATAWLKKRLKSDQVGNLIFWVTFCIVGQPTSLILYYHDWIILNRPGWLPAALSQPDPVSPVGLP